MPRYGERMVNPWDRWQRASSKAWIGLSRCVSFEAGRDVFAEKAG